LDIQALGLIKQNSDNHKKNNVETEKICLNAFFICLNENMPFRILIRTQISKHEWFFKNKKLYCTGVDSEYIKSR